MPLTEETWMDPDLLYQKVDQIDYSLFEDLGWDVHLNERGVDEGPEGKIKSVFIRAEDPNSSQTGAVIFVKAKNDHITVKVHSGTIQEREQFWSADKIGEQLPSMVSSVRQNLQEDITEKKERLKGLSAMLENEEATFPLTYQREHVGEIEVAAEAPDADSVHETVKRVTEAVDDHQ